jgi:uncharacterized DUF497 family protein
MHSMAMDFEFDPDKAKANLHQRKVSFSRAEQALRDPNAFMIEDPDSDDQPSFVTLGMDSLS